MRLSRLLVSIAALGLVLAACSDDDGAAVRDVSNGSSGSGSGSGSASGLASGVAPSEECEVVGGSEADDDAELHLELSEFAITVAEGDEVAAGNVKFEATNAGDEPHELVIVRAESIASLPTDDDGALVEDDLGDDAFIGEIEPFASGDECQGTFGLDEGSYVLLCNIVETDGDRTEAHLAEGMAAELRVTG